MAIREIRKHKDEILYKRAKEVEFIDENTKTLIKDMIDTLYKYDGVGLAAPQVGSLKRILVYDVDYIEDEKNKNPHVVINPVITKVSKKMATAEEGCLSFPDLYGYVDRPAKITVEALDENLNPIVIKDAVLLEAVVLQHEMDHLNGKVFVDKAYNTYVGERPEEDTKKSNKNKKKRK